MSVIATQNRAAAAVEYALYRQDGDSALYVGPAHSDLIKDQMVLKSAAPKTTLTSRGNRRSSLNLITGQTVANPAGDNVVKDMKTEFSASIPAGTSFEDFAESVKRLTTILNDDDALRTFFYQGMLTK